METSDYGGSDEAEEGVDTFSSSPGPGDLAAMAEHGEDDEPLDESPVPSEGEPSGVTGLVVGEPEQPTL